MGGFGKFNIIKRQYNTSFTVAHSLDLSNIALTEQALCLLCLIKRKNIHWFARHQTTSTVSTKYLNMPDEPSWAEVQFTAWNIFCNSSNDLASVVEFTGKTENNYPPLFTNPRADVL